MRLSWRQVYRQFGVDPSRASDKRTVDAFRTDCLRELKKIKLAWPDLNYAAAQGRPDHLAFNAAHFPEAHGEKGRCEMTAVEIGMMLAMMLAVVTGPLSAVLIAWALEKRRVQRERRMDIFRTLMRTRTGSARLSADHVAALNLVEVEFRNDSGVRDAWKQYFEILRQLGQKQHVEPLSMEKSLAKLLQVMSKTLGYKIEGLEIFFEGGYTPQYWETIETEWRSIREYVIALAQGNAAVPVKEKESIPEDS